jgi:hypothetical protein
MTWNRLGGALAGLALLVSAAPVAAQVPKAPPAGRMYGYIFIDGVLPDSGTPIAAYVGATLCGQNSYDQSPFGGRYFIDLDSSLPDCNQPGAPVTFLIGSCSADATGTVPAFNGAQRVDMNAPSSC